MQPSNPRQPDPDRDRADAQLIDHAASYLRHRLNLGQFAGLDGIYAGYTMCGLLDHLAATYAGETCRPTSDRH